MCISRRSAPKTGSVLFQYWSIFSKLSKKRRYDFSKAQAGKNACDRKIAPMKAHIRRYLNDGHNVTTGHKMKPALDSYGGVNGVKVAVVEVNPERQDIKTHKWD